MLKKNFGKKVTILYISFHFFIYGDKQINLEQFHGESKSILR